MRLLQQVPIHTALQTPHSPRLPKPTTSHTLSSGLPSTPWANLRKQRTLLETHPHAVSLSITTLREAFTSITAKELSR